MQSRPTDVSQEDLLSSNPSDQLPTAQHGLEDFRGNPLDAHHGEEHASIGRRSPTSSEGSGWSRSASTSTSTSGGERRLRESWSNVANPRDRIAEYERASSNRTKKSKKHNGPEFRVISRGDNLDSTSSTFSTFPNGMHTLILMALSHLTQLRGSDTHLVPSATCKPDCGIPRIAQIPRTRNHSTRVASRVFTQFSRSTVSHRRSYIGLFWR